MEIRGKTLDGLWGPMSWSMASLYVPVLGAASALVFAALLGHMREDDEAFPSIRYLAWECGLNTGTVVRTLEGLAGRDGRLAKAGLLPLIEIQRSEREDGGIGSNVYSLTEHGNSYQPKSKAKN